MDRAKQANEYRLLACRIRAEATLMDGAMGERKLETARAFEIIAETLERVIDEREESENRRRRSQASAPFS